MERVRPRKPVVSAPPDLGSETPRWSWRYEVGSLAIVLLGGSVVGWLGGVPPLQPALAAAVLAQALTLALGRSVGQRGRYLPGLLLFVGTAALTEAREGRGSESALLIPMLVVLALVRVWLSYAWAHGVDRPRDDAFAELARRSAAGWLVPLALPMLLVLLGLYSAASGGADRMSSWFSWLPTETMGTAVLIVRKCVHATFYPLLALSILPALGRVRSDVRANAPWALALTAVFAGFDEVRQAGIPGRTGSAWDVLLDLTATAIVLALVIRRAGRADAGLS